MLMIYNNLKLGEDWSMLMVNNVVVSTYLITSKILPFSFFSSVIRTHTFPWCLKMFIICSYLTIVLVPALVLGSALFASMLDLDNMNKKPDWAKDSEVFKLEEN